MKVLLDTSVLVAAMVESHPAHDSTIQWLRDVRSGVHTGFVAAHTLAELYAVLTALPLRPRIRPIDALSLIQRDVLGMFSIVALTIADYLDVLQEHAAANLSGGTIYDAVITKAALKAGVDQIVTLNIRHFRTIAAGRIVVVEAH